MLKLRWIGAVLILSLLVISSGAFADLTARGIMDEFSKRHKVKSYISTNVMLLADNKGNKEQRVLKVFYKEFGEGQSRALYVFQEPVTVKGVAVLTWINQDRDDDQWLYLPSTQKMVRIAQSSKKSYFMGTDITYEDMEPEKADDFEYSLLPEETIDEQACYVIQAVPATGEKKKASGYSKRVIWLRKDIFFAVKIEFFDPRGRSIKIQTLHDLKNIEGTVWRAGKALIDNSSQNHKTAVGIRSDETNVEIDDSVFTERYILSGKHVQ